MNTFPYKPPSVWDNSDIQQRLSELWKTGLSAASIARSLNKEFDTAISRNAVLGRARRQGLPRRPSPIIRTGQGRKEKNRAKARRELNGGQKAGPRGAGLNAMRPLMLDPSPYTQCQYIAGEPTQFDDCKCLEPTVRGSSYCAEHHAVCHYVLTLESKAA